MAGRGSGSSNVALMGRSSRRDTHRLKSGRGDDVSAFRRILMVTSGL